MSFSISGIIGAIKRDGQLVFAALAKDIEAAAAAIVKALGPSAQAFAEQEVRYAKQFASDAIAMADSYLGSHQQAIALATEQAIETELAILTGGRSVAFNGLTAKGVDDLVSAAVAGAHNAGLAIKARLAQGSGQAFPVPPPAPPSVPAS